MRGIARATLTRVGALIVVACLTPAIATAQQDHEHEHEHEEDGHAEARHLGHHGGFAEYVDVFFTRHAYLERKLHPSVQTTRADGLDRWTAAVELAWQFTERLGGEIAVPIVRTDPEVGDGSSGVGDVEIAPMIALVQDPDRQLIVSARSGFVLPTGDEDEGLGDDGLGWEPGLLAWKAFGAERRGTLQAEVGYDRVFADEGADHEQIVYNLAFSWWLPSNFIPIVELNGATPVGDEADAHDDHEHDDHEHGIVPARGPLVGAHGGIEAGENTLIAGTIGFRYAFANGQQWGAGVQVPVSGDDAFDARIVVGGIIHLE